MKEQKRIIAVSVIFCVLVLAIVISMNVKSSQDQFEIVESEVKSQLIATSLAAREFIDPEAFNSYQSINDTEADAYSYDETLGRLRHLAESVGAEYIYALKVIDGKYYFVFDTDTEVDTRFTEYEPSRVHAEALAGNNVADVMNVSDEFGNFNTGAVPIYFQGEIVGVVATDITDTYIQQSQSASLINTIILAVLLVVTLAAMIVLISILATRVRKMQEKLERMALYDTITGLPNRQHLIEYLEELTGQSNEPFALFFIDLDNFKTVNDKAGHDAGDELLRHIAHYLDTMSQNAKSFRPAAGRLNIAARIGGDEFIQVVSGVSKEDQASELAEELLENFKSKHLDRYIEKYQVGLSIGVALYPCQTEDYNVLIKYADIAMYHAKKAGKNRYRIYNDEMSQEEQ